MRNLVFVLYAANQLTCLTKNKYRTYNNAGLILALLILFSLPMYRWLSNIYTHGISVCPIIRFNSLTNLRI